MTWQTRARDFLWPGPERLWWGGMITNGFCGCLGVWWGRTGRWQVALPILIAIIVTESTLFHKWVRPNRTPNDVAP